MSLTRLVVEMIAERGCGTVDHLMPRLEEQGYTRKQANKALQNACTQGFLWCEKTTKAGKPKHGTHPGVYWPGKREVDPLSSILLQKRREPPLAFVPSVFKLANPLPESALPRITGTVHRPMGAWDLL